MSTEIIKVATATGFRSTSLPEAPERKTLAEAEADEKRGRELKAFLALLPEPKDERWDVSLGDPWGAAMGSAWDAARRTSLVGAWTTAWEITWETASGPDGCGMTGNPDWGNAAEAAAGAAAAIVVRDHISIEHFDSLTAPMKEAGIDFDSLVSTDD